MCSESPVLYSGIEGVLVWEILGIQLVDDTSKSSRTRSQSINSTLKKYSTLLQIRMFSNNLCDFVIFVALCFGFQIPQSAIINCTHIYPQQIKTKLLVLRLYFFLVSFRLKHRRFKRSGRSHCGVVCGLHF